MKPTPKILLGVLIILFFTSLLFFLYIFNSQSSNSLTIDSKQNEFTLNFQVNRKKIPQFEHFLEELDIPYQIEKGVSFKLDSTSSTYLDLLTPIKVSLDISSNRIFFTGYSARPFFLKSQAPDQIHIPQHTSLAIFAPDLSGFVTSRLDFSKEVKNIFENTVQNDSGHYLLIFGSKPSFALFFKKTDLDLSSFKEVPQEASEAAGKQQDQNQITKFYLINSQTEKQNTDAGVFFDLSTYKVFASSIDAAKEVISAQNTSGLLFPKSKETSASFILNFNNRGLSDNFTNFAFNKGIGITGGQEKIKNSLSKIKEASITLKGSTFSGLISTE